MQINDLFLIKFLEIEHFDYITVCKQITDI